MIVILYFNISISCYFILLHHYNLEGNVVLFTPLYSFWKAQVLVALQVKIVNTKPVIVKICILNNLRRHSTNAFFWRLKTFWHVTEGKAQVWIIKWMMVEFHLAASVSGSWCCACWLTVMTYWNTWIEQSHRYC